MQLAQNIHPVHAQLPGTSTKAQIQANAKMFRLLSDKLYSDKSTAILRELGANAVDAHHDAGKDDVPFRVTLPTPLDPVLRIRDFGTGMSESFIHSVYWTYGDTNKSHTNLAIGGLGLGGKTPIAYADSYQLISWWGGEKKTYVAYINSTGEPEISRPIATEPCGNETGVELIIPVDQADFPRFRYAAVNTYRWFEPLPHVNTLISPVKWLLKTETFGLRANATYGDRLVVLMGPIPYPVDRAQFHSLPHLSEQERTLVYGIFDTYGLVLFANIGDVDITPNREALSYDKASLVKLTELILRTARTVIASMQDQLDVHETFTSAYLAYREMLANTRFDSDLTRQLTWRGQPFQSRKLPFVRNLIADTMYETDFRRSRVKYTPHLINCFSPWELVARNGGYHLPKIYYFDDPKLKVGPLLKHNEIKLKAETPFIVVTHPTTAQLRDIRLMFDDQVELRRLEDLPQVPKPVRTPRAPTIAGSAAAPRARRVPKTASLLCIDENTIGYPSDPITVELEVPLENTVYLKTEKGDYWPLNGKGNADLDRIRFLIKHPALLNGWRVLLLPSHHTKTLATIGCPPIEEVLEERIAALPGTPYDLSLLSDWVERDDHDAIEFIQGLQWTTTAEEMCKRLPHSRLSRLFSSNHDLVQRINTIQATYNHLRHSFDFPSRTTIHWVEPVIADAEQVIRRYPLLDAAYQRYRTSRWERIDQASALVANPAFADYIRLYDNLRND